MCAQVQAIRRGLLNCKGVVEENRVPCEAVAEQDEVNVCFGYGLRVCLLELVGAVRRDA